MVSLTVCWGAIGFIATWLGLMVLAMLVGWGFAVLIATDNPVKNKIGWTIVGIIFIAVLVALYFNLCKIM